MSEIKTALANASQKDGSYIVCFTSVDPIKVGETIVITGKDKPLFIQGLSIKPKMVRNPLTSISEPFKGPLISVTGSDVTLQDLKILPNPEIGITQSALSITGSNVSIVDSQIHASQTGIAIGTAEKAADNISISGTKVAGNGSADSKGIAIVNSSSVSVSAASEIDNFAIGIDGKAMLDQVVFKIPNKDSIPIQNDGNKIDATKVVKKLDAKDDKTVTAIMGPSPVACSQETASSKVALYFYDDANAKYIYHSACSISASLESFCLVSAGLGPVNCSKDSTDFPIESCFFECNADFSRVYKIRLGYQDQNKISYVLSNDLPVKDIPSVIVGPPIEVPVPMPGELDTTHTGSGPSSEVGDGGGTTVAVLGSRDDPGPPSGGTLYYEPTTAQENDGEETVTPSDRTMGADGAGGGVGAGAAKMGCRVIPDSSFSSKNFTMILPIAFLGAIVLVCVRKKLLS